MESCRKHPRRKVNSAWAKPSKAPAACASPQTSHHEWCPKAFHRAWWWWHEVLFWQLQTELKPKIEFIRVAANWRCVMFLILPGWESETLEVDKSSTTHGTLSQSLIASLPMFLRVKVAYAFFRSVLSQLFSPPSYGLHMFNTISRMHVSLFFLPQLSISTWLRGETGDEKMVKFYL